jgi:phosphotransferase system enzyme I (PtsI)
MCGEMAGDPRFARLLLGVGLRHFSMQPGSLLEIKEIVRSADVGALHTAVDDLYRHLDDASPEQFLERLNRLG